MGLLKLIAKRLAQKDNDFPLEPDRKRLTIHLDDISLDGGTADWIYEQAFGIISIRDLIRKLREDAQENEHLDGLEEANEEDIPILEALEKQGIAYVDTRENDSQERIAQTLNDRMERLRSLAYNTKKDKGWEPFRFYELARLEIKKILTEKGHTKDLDWYASEKIETADYAAQLFLLISNPIDLEADYLEATTQDKTNPEKEDHEDFPRKPDLAERARSIVQTIMPGVSCSVSLGRPMELFSSLINGSENEEKLKDYIVTITFNDARVAERFYNEAEGKGYKVDPYRTIVKRGLNWVRSKTFKAVIMVIRNA